MNGYHPGKRTVKLEYKTVLFIVVKFPSLSHYEKRRSINDFFFNYKSSKLVEELYL